MTTGYDVWIRKNDDHLQQPIEDNNFFCDYEYK